MSRRAQMASVCLGAFPTDRTAASSGPMERSRKPRFVSATTASGWAWALSRWVASWADPDSADTHHKPHAVLSRGRPCRTRAGGRIWSSADERFLKCKKERAKMFCFVVEQKGGIVTSDTHAIRLGTAVVVVLFSP